MTTYLGKSCSFGFEGRMWDLIVSVPDHCLSFFSAILCEMHLMTFGLVQRHRNVKSNVTAPEVDGYRPMINNSHGVFH